MNIKYNYIYIIYIYIHYIYKMKDFNDKLKNNQISEKELIENLKFFNSNVCLQTQINLSPYFCFRYLYDNHTESINNRVYYNNIIDYFRNKNIIEIYDGDDNHNETTNFIYNKLTKTQPKDFIDIMNTIFNNAIMQRKYNTNKLKEIKIQNNVNNDVNNDKYTPLFSCINTNCNSCIDKYCNW